MGKPLEIPPGGCWSNHRWFDGFASAFVASVFSALGFSFGRLPAFGLDHKLLQALALEPYWGEVVPHTEGLSKYASKCNVSELPKILDLYFPNGYVVKPAVGAGTGDRGNFDRSSHLVRLVQRTGARLLHPGSEKWVVQEYLPISEEMRIHTFDRYVVPGLSCLRWDEGAFLSDRHNSVVVEFGELISRLPDSIISGTAWGWDVARLMDGRLVVVEGNPAGVFFRSMVGFNCSGYFSDHRNGPFRLVQLWNFLRERFGFSSIVVVSPFPREFSGHIESMAVMMPEEFCIRRKHDYDRVLSY